MTSLHSESEESQDQSSSDGLFVNVHVIECGQGDTVLLHLPGPKWVLVDCHLASREMRDRFFDIIEQYQVERLDLLVLTHPHADHFSGMLDVVDHFTTAGRSIGVFCDCGVDPVQVLDLLKRANRPQSEIREYERLHHRLDQLIENHTIRYCRVDENCHPLQLAGRPHDVQFIPVGPEPGFVREMIRDAIVKSASSSKLNDLSLLLLLMVRSRDATFSFLLGADAESRSLNRGLDVWQSRLENDQSHLDALKVPHHGSATSFSSQLCGSGRRESESVAAVSVGTKFKAHPDREVLRRYLEDGWTVVLTTKRVKPRRKQFAFELAGRRTDAETGFQRRSIEISWSEKEGLRWSPEESQLKHDEIELYETAIKPLAKT